MSTTEDSVDVAVGEVVTVVVDATKDGREVVPEDVVRRPQVLAIGVVVAADGTTTRGGTEILAYRLPRRSRLMYHSCWCSEVARDVHFPHVFVSYYTSA